MSGLRPIGTVFNIVVPASMTGTDPSPHRLTMLVVAHDDYGRDGILERVVEVSRETLPAPTTIPLWALQTALTYRDWQQEYASQFNTEPIHE